jgi:hypothetical protein
VPGFDELLAVQLDRADLGVDEVLHLVRPDADLVLGPDAAELLALLEQQIREVPSPPSARPFPTRGWPQPSAFAFATPPSQASEGFGCRRNVVRSQAISPKVASKLPHS